MNKLPSKFTLTIKPREYLVQGLSHCGAYSVKGILSAYGKDNKRHPKEYHSGWLGKLTGGSFGEQYWIFVLRQYGLKATFHSAKNLEEKEKIDLLKHLLSNNTPVMIRMGNGYFRSTIYNSLLGKLVPHWVTLWGYSDKEKIFYIYDSGLTKNLYMNDIPIGNTIRTYEEIIRDWNFGSWQPWTWHTSRQSFVYIQIHKSEL